MAVRSALINVMTAAALKAARGMIRDFGEVEQLQVSVKGPGDFVTQADLKAEKVLRAELARARPGYGFLMEESGTTHFLHGIPQFCISIGLERDGEIVAGVVYEPIRDEMFWGEKGQGAYVNDRRLRVSARRQLSESVIATGIPTIRGKIDRELYMRTLGAVMGATVGVRRFGAAALDLAYVAAGRVDGFWEFGLQPWDMAAGILLIREAGGYITGLTDGKHDPMASGDVIAANDHLHLPLAALIKEAMKTPGRT